MRIFRMIEIGRKIFNRVFYFFFGVFARTPFGYGIILFPSANGWCVTWRRGEWVYKMWGPFFWLHPCNSFKRFKEFHYYLKSCGLNCVPYFNVHRFYIKYRYVEGARGLLNYVFSLKNSHEKIDFFIKLFLAVDDLHTKKIVHNDLKPKNILVGNDRSIYFIDYENSFIMQNFTDIVIDFEKLIPRLIYTLTAFELEVILRDSRLTEETRNHLAKYLEDFNIKSILSSCYLEYEAKESDESGEDLDVRVKSFADVKDIVEILKKERLDFFLFFHARNDIKIFVYNVRKIVSIDLHLVRPLGKFHFLYHKMLQNSPEQIALTGPDGSGKTTLTEWFVTNHNMARNKNLIRCAWFHANRFERSVRPNFINPPVWSRFLDKATCGYYFKFWAYIKLLSQNTKALLIFDRSFLDQLINRDGEASKLFFLIRFFLPKKINNILIRVPTDEILKRKKELSKEAVEKYYKFIEKHLWIFASIDALNIEDAKYQFSTIVYFILFTNRKFKY